MATYTGTCGKYTIILNVSEVSSSVDVSSNTSKVSWSLQFRADTAYCQWNPGPGDFEVKINGASVWSAQNPSLWFSGSGQTLTLASGTSGAITHNSDGTKTVSCQAIYTQNSTANYLPSSGSCSGNLKLSTIPRASSFSSITGNVIGKSQTINIDRKSSNFTNNLWYRVGDEDWVPIGTGIETSKTWTLPTSLNNKIPNATSLTLTYLLRTYNGSTQIGGDVTYNFNVNYSGEKPTAGTATITYSKLFNNKFIANYSSGTINYNGYDGVYGSTVKSAQVVFNGSWKSTTSYNTGLLTAGTHTFQGVVTDSRGNTSYTTQQSFTCYQINNPTVSINAYRSDSSGNANPSGTYITIIPTYSAHDPVGGNSIKSSSFTCTSLMTNGTAITSGSKKILSGAATDSQYVISGTVTDQLGRTSATSVQIGTAFALWDVRPDQRGMAFGKYSTGVDKFEVAWPAYFDNSLNATGDVRVGSNFGAGEGTIAGVALHSANGGIELSGATPYIDFHYNNSSDDYTTRIIANSATQLKITGNVWCGNQYLAGETSEYMGFHSSQTPDSRYAWIGRNGSDNTKFYLTAEDNITQFYFNKEIYAPNLSDSGWKTATLNSNFVNYTDAQAPKYRKIGKVVNLVGAVKPAREIAGSSTQYTILTLPAGYRPSTETAIICQGSNTCIWCMRIKTNGIVAFERYRNGSSYATASTTTWLPFNVLFFID